MRGVASMLAMDAITIETRVDTLRGLDAPPCSLWRAMEEPIVLETLRADRWLKYVKASCADLACSVSVLSLVRSSLGPVQFRKWVRYLRLVRAGLKVELPISISPSAAIRAPSQVKLGRNAIVKSRTIISGRSSHSYGVTAGANFYVKEDVYVDSYGGFVNFGDHVAIGQKCAIHGNGGISIGSFFMMGNGAMILAGNHNHKGIGEPYLFQGTSAKGIRIGSNVWIGAGAIVCDGSVIGSNVVVGAGTIVSGAVPDNVVATGNRTLQVSQERT